MPCDCIKKEDLNIIFKEYLAKRHEDSSEVGKEEYYMLLKFLKFIKEHKNEN